jgi:SAUR family protein
MGSKCNNKIHCIVRLRQMLRRWRARAAASAGHSSDVPAGHVVVSVNSHRFIVRTAYLNHPAFKQLLHLAEEEYGFNNMGPLELPCDESLFRVVLRHVSSSKRGVSLDELRNGVCGCGCCAVKGGPGGRWQPDSWPLLGGFNDQKAVW